jgi:alkanesulfonate monooxygenase SsuD/methylene tetrahydromethanopterin reductase-like flavin-dependent oxidoreductase (luciferase family)
MSKLLFGISLSTSAAPGADPVTDARHAEALGFDVLTVSDHLQGRHATYETWTLLSWVAARTERIGLMTNVLGLPYRPAPVVAKMAESLDRMSGQRLILGLGAGGLDDEFRAFGLPVRTPGEKLVVLEESIDVMRGLWNNPTFSYEGRFVQTASAQIEPKAVRAIPIWLGAYRPRALALIGRRADGWSLSYPYAPLETAAALRQQVLRAASDAGRDLAEIVCNYNVGVRVDENATPRQGVVAGSPGQVAEELTTFVRAGFTSLIISPVGDEREQRERLAHEVLPEIRSLLA